MSLEAIVEALPKRPFLSSDCDWTVLQQAFPDSLVPVSSVSPLRSYPRSSTSCAPGTANGGLTPPPAARIAMNGSDAAGLSSSWTLKAAAASPLEDIVSSTGVRSVV